MSQLVRFYGPMIISYMTMMVIMILAFQMRRQMMFFKFYERKNRNRKFSNLRGRWEQSKSQCRLPAKEINITE
jgi:hypothetical protein